MINSQYHLELPLQKNIIIRHNYVLYVIPQYTTYTCTCNLYVVTYLVIKENAVLQVLHVNIILSNHKHACKHKKDSIINNSCSWDKAYFLVTGLGSVWVVGLDKLYSFFCLLFLLTILKKSAYYSSLVYPLFQFKDVTFILKRQFICGCYYSIKKWNIIVLSFAFARKRFFQKRKYSRSQYCD